MTFKRSIKKRIKKDYGEFVAKSLLEMVKTESQSTEENVSETISDLFIKNTDKLSVNELKTSYAWFIEGHTLVNKITEKFEDINIQPLSEKLKQVQKVIIESFLNSTSINSVRYKLIISIILWRIWQIIENMKIKKYSDDGISTLLALYSIITGLFHKNAMNNGLKICITDFLFSRNHQNFHKEHEIFALKTLQNNS